MNEELMKATKEQKHLVINSCLDELESEICRYETLVSRIENSGKESDPTEERKLISLVEFLNETPNRLGELTKSLVNCRQKIQEYLF